MEHDELDDECQCDECHIESVRNGDIEKCGCKICQEQAETDYELAHEE